MRKRFLLSLIGVLGITVASHMAVLATVTTYYFSSSTGDNANQGLYGCSQAHPCHDFAGTTLDNAGALSPGDSILFKRGDEWDGSQAFVMIDSAGSFGLPVTMGAYGTGANPILAGAAVTSAGWSVFSGNIYQIASQSQTYLQVVTQDDNAALMRYGGSTSTVPEGYFVRSGTTLYVHLHGNVNPATHNVRIANYMPSFTLGLIRDSITSIARAAYHDYRDLTVICTNGVGFSRHGSNGRDAGLKIIGTGQDGYLGWYRSTNGQAQQFESYYVEVNGAAANGASSGAGQGITLYGSPFVFFVGAYSHDNGMAGIDFLDFASDTNVTESGLIRCRSENNALTTINPSYDADIYFDGGSELFAYGCRMGKSRGGVPSNIRNALQIGSEHPTTKPPENIWFVNSLGYGTFDKVLTTGVICYNSTTECPPSGDATPAKTVKNLTIAYNTWLTLNSGGGNQFDAVRHYGDHSLTADNFIERNNVFVGKSSYIDPYVDSGTFLDADHNLFFMRGQTNSATAIIFNDCVNCSGSTYTIAQWRTASGEDANSAYGDPLLVTDSDTVPDVHLQNTSPARDLGQTSAYTYPAWLPQSIKDDIGPYGVRGTTKADGTFDDVATAPDSGFHYDYARLTNITVTPTSNTKDTVTTYTVNFRMLQYSTALLHNWKIKFTLPAGCTLSSGSASTFASSDISGTWTTSVVGQTITGTRVGDGNSEFPGLYSFTVTNVRNPNSAATTGTFLLEIDDASGTKISEPYTDATATNTIPGIVISSGAGAVCGNSIIEVGEGCDDGNTTPGDGCSASCQVETPVCGNSIVESGEQCDDGNTNNGDGCSNTCQIETPVCGNSIIESGEQCDDGNTANGDGCSDTCQTEASQPGPHLSASGGRTLSGNATIS